MFQEAEPVNRSTIARIHQKLEAADTLERHDAAPIKRIRYLAQRINLRARLLGGFDPDAWPAHRAGVGLGVKPAVKGFGVLPRAIRAHAKAAHGGVGTVVGDLQDDAVARAAVGAVGERVAVATILAIPQFSQAGRAGGQIR